MGNPRRSPGSFRGGGGVGRGGKGGGQGRSKDVVHEAARMGDLVSLQSALFSNPLVVNSRDRHSRTPLHLAAWSGQTDVVRYLCTNKADVGAAAMDDMGAIHFASQKGHLEIVRILISSGVSVKVANRKGFTPLHYAAKGSHLELVKYLTRKGASLSVKTKAGETPADLAENEDIRSFLEESEKSSKEEKEDTKSNNVDEKMQDRSVGEHVSGEQAVTVDQRNEMDDGERAVELDAEDNNGEGEKRKGEKIEIEESSSSLKKPKVALSHLLVEDDLQEYEEE